jgi:hypothetical protein
MNSKFFFFLIVALCFCGSINAQCVNGISTNPNAPKNDQFIYHLPFNPFLNTFDWMYVYPPPQGGFQDIQLNPFAESRRINAVYDTVRKRT